MSNEIDMDTSSDSPMFDGPKVATKKVKASGLIKIFDKDGKLKSELKIVSLETKESGKNAT